MTHPIGDGAWFFESPLSQVEQIFNGKWKESEKIGGRWEREGSRTWNISHWGLLPRDKSTAFNINTTLCELIAMIRCILRPTYWSLSSNQFLNPIKIWMLSELSGKYLDQLGKRTSARNRFPNIWLKNIFIFFQFEIKLIFQIYSLCRAKFVYFVDVRKQANEMAMEFVLDEDCNSSFIAHLHLCSLLI